MSNARILVVEDDPIIVMELEERLNVLGYQACGSVMTGLDAIDQAVALRPDLVLMDIRLKGSMDGIEAAAQIRARLDIPVVYVTAYADDDTLARARVAEPYGYIVKPFTERELHTAIEIALYKYHMERRLRDRERWLAATLRSIGDAVLVTTESGRVAFLNPVAETLTGWLQAEALDRNIGEVLTVVDETTRMSSEPPAIHALRSGMPIDLSGLVLKSRDGQERPIEGCTTLIHDERGRVEGTVVVFRDVGERRRQEKEREELQAQLFQAQKMEVVGMLAGGIAHDFNNLMTTIVGYASLVLSRLSDMPGHPAREGIQAIQQAGERAAALTEQILAFSRKQRPEPTLLNLNTIVVNLEDMIRRLVGEDVTVLNTLGATGRHVKVDPAQMEQVIMNLIVNAQQAMPEGGRLTIQTETVTLSEAACQGLPDAYPGTFIRLSVSDTGIGIDDETLPHIFEPFYSTKGKGSGLGLSIARNIVCQSGGWMSVASIFGRGSTFQVYLPAFRGEGDVHTWEQHSVPELQGESRRILLIEDDEGVRGAVCEMLRLGGYSVVTAVSAADARKVFEREGGQFDLVLSDVVLPDRDGLQLVDDLLTRSPDLPVLLTSGYPDERAQWPLIRERGYGFLRKPFSISELLFAIRAAMQ